MSKIRFGDFNLLLRTKSPRKSARRQATAAKPVVAGEISYEQFLQWDGDNQHVEWVEGMMIEMAAVSDEHGALQMFFAKVVGLFVDDHDLGETRGEPFQMKTGPALPGRSPDLLFVAKRNLSRIKPLCVQGPADMVIEIVSAGSVTVDRGEKYREYEKGGVREYWLIDPIRKQADFYLLGRDGLYHRMPADERGVFYSGVLKGFWLQVEWLWRKPLPSSSMVRKAWKVAAT